MPAFGWVTRGDSPSSPSFSSPCWSAPSPFTSKDPWPADHLLRPPYGCHGCQGGRRQHAFSNRLTGSPRTFKGWPNRPSSPAHLAPPAPPRIVWYNRTLPPTSLLLFVEALRIAWKRLSSTVLRLNFLSHHDLFCLFHFHLVRFLPSLLLGIGVR